MGRSRCWGGRIAIRVRALRRSYRNRYALRTFRRSCGSCEWGGSATAAPEGARAPNSPKGTAASGDDGLHVEPVTQVDPLGRPKRSMVGKSQPTSLENRMANMSGMLPTRIADARDTRAPVMDCLRPRLRKRIVVSRTHVRIKPQHLQGSTGEIRKGQDSKRRV